MIPGENRIVLALLWAIALVGLTGASSSDGTVHSSNLLRMNPWKQDAFPQVGFGFLAHGQFSWPEIQPKAKGQWEYGLFDAYVAGAQNSGSPLYDATTNTVNVAITLGLTPEWAAPSWATASSKAKAKYCPHKTRKGSLQCSVPPASIKDWTTFLEHLTQHYNGQIRNGINYPHIRLYELWNEADDQIWWAGWDITSAPLPPEYSCPANNDPNFCPLVALASAAYLIIHKDPYSKLLTPSVVGAAATTWLPGYLKATGDQYADGGAYHGYIGKAGLWPYPMPEDDSGYGSLTGIATNMRAAFDASKLSGKPMFQTEGSWGNNNITDPDTQVAWLARYYLLQAGLFSSKNLQMAAWFAWDGPPLWGVIARPSNANPPVITPTPAGLAYTQVFNWLVGSTFVQPCSGASDGTWTCTLTRADGSAELAVWNRNGCRLYVPDTSYNQYFCLDGTSCLAGNPVPLAIGQQIIIGPKPILLVGTPPVPPPPPKGPPNCTQSPKICCAQQQGTLVNGVCKVPGG